MTYLPTCTFPGDRADALIDYLYGERGSPPGRAFADHLAACAVCRTEVGELGGVRRALDAWSPPEPYRALTSEPVGPRRLAAFPRRTPSHSEIGPVANQSVALPSRWALPVWARAAAVIACVGVGLGAANLRVSYGPDGVSVQTGWFGSTQNAAPTARTVEQSTPNARTESDAPWRAELATLEEQLRSEMHQVPGVTPAAATDTEAILQKVKMLVSQSEQRQQRELALRLGDLRNDVHAQRLADLSRIERSIGVVQSNTGMEVLRQREILNSLAVKVSQRP
jgi:hypothetical protein